MYFCVYFISMKKLLFISFIVVLTIILNSCGVYKEPCEGVTIQDQVEENS